MNPGEIPIADAAKICKARGCAYVIVFGVREDGQRFHVTTYGKTKTLCKVAGSICDQMADAVLNGKVAPPPKEPQDWIDTAADGIRSRWLQWEEEAEQLAQSAQDSRAGEEHLQTCLTEYLRWCRSIHERE
jgi:hypothetical protein